MKALRRSMKGEKHKQQNPSIGSKSAVAIIPPKKVIRANDDYQPDEALIQSFAKAGAQVLSFSKGDFFHVIGREDDPHWYEACNPALPDARGLVPVSYFQVLGRTERDSSQSDGGRMPAAKIPDHDSGYGETAMHPTAPTTLSHSQQNSKSAKASGILHATVRYTFTADPARPDELSAQENEPLIIIAQSNNEWVVAKPIERLGGPGLIPIGFINVYDQDSYKNSPPTPVSDSLEAIRKAGVPSVEEWKRMAAQYKNSSITLGKFDGGRSNAGQQAAIEQGMGRMSLHQAQGGLNGTQYHGGQYGHSRASHQPVDPNSFGTQSAAQLSSPVWARIPRYCFAEDKYWFVIEAELEDGRCWELSRYYQDFYDFQIALLAEFPAEAGNTGTQKRTLPYMPGPVSYVTDAITEGRLYNLDAYVKSLLNQPPHIARCDLVKLFFAPREGDYEIDPNAAGDYRLSQGSHQSSAESPAYVASRQSSRNNMNDYGIPGPASAHQAGGNAPQASSARSQPGDGTASSAMKIKVRFKDDLIAMRVPTDIQYQDLHDKIRDRVKAAPGEQMRLFYQDDATGSRHALASNEELDYALQRNEKLTLFVEVV